MDEHNDERLDGSIAILAPSSSGSKGAASSSRIIKNLSLPASSTSSSSASSSSSRAVTPAVVPVQVPPCCDVGLACLDTSLVCCTDRECSDDGKQQNSDNIIQDPDCPQCETAAKEDANTPCTDPGCQLLEWDEQAVDELLRCCCSSDTAHGHRSFATTPYTAAGSSITSIDGPYKHPAPPLLPSNSSHARPPDDFRFLPPSNNTYTPYIPHTHSHTHLHPPFQSLPQLPPDSRSEASTSHSSSTNSFSFSSPALSSLSSGHTNNNIQPLHLSSEDKKVYKCQWSLCPATFQDKESLIGHVNASHLMSAEAQPEKDAQVIPSASGMLGGAGDDSFEHTLKCLWDSCSASLPLLQVPSVDTNTNGASSCLNHHHTGDMLPGMNGDAAISAIAGGPHISGRGGTHSHSMQTQPSLPLQDAPTATLVRHLLQDHLHIPSDVLSLLSPSLGVSNPLQAPSNGLSQAALVQSQDVKPGYLPPAPLAMASSVGNHYASPQQYSLPQYPHTMHSPAHSHTSRPQSVASGSNYNSPAFPSFSQHQHIPSVGSLSDNIHENDLKDLAKHARNASLDSLASSVLEASYGLQQQQQHQQSWQSHSRNASMSELYPVSVSALPPSHPRGVDSINSSEVHLCGWKDCGASFSTTSALMEHISTSHIGSGKSIYYCHWVGCERAHSGRGFNQRQKIQRHLRTHVGDKPFVCPFPGCLSKFSESTTLNQHIRTQHTSEKPFKCDFEGCGKSFALQSALTIHKRTHSGEKPFKCPVEGCGMRFAESSNLSKHVKTHRNHGEDAEGSVIDGEQKSKKRKRKSVALDEQDEEDEESDSILTSFGAQTNGTISGKTPKRQRSRN